MTEREGGQMSNLDKIDHIVVLMLENRSFDNMLGWLQDPDNQPPFDNYNPEPPVDGVTGKDLSNPRPDSRDTVPVGKGSVMINPSPDPGEEYYHINTQLFGSVAPESNRFATDPPDPRYRNFFEELLFKITEFVEGLFGSKKSKIFTDPFNLPDPMPTIAPMDGFVQDYVNNFTATQGRAPTADEYGIIMDCFTPDSVPVISQLAQQFAVCDSWHCSVPSQTFCNRSFVASGTSNGFVVNAPYLNWLFTDSPTIFNRVEEDPRDDLTWRVYFDEQDVTTGTFLMQPKLWPYRTSNFSTMDRFHDDARNGKLPSYSFVEPRLFIDHNDQHPPIANPLVTSSVLAGELLIKEIYESLRDGPDWDNTLLIITYDEHGGCYDHVSPPAATPPDTSKAAGQFGFRFDRLGIRVPAVLVSPLIPPGTVVKTLFDHTSVIKTVTNRWGLPGLTERDAAATDVSGVLSLDAPRTDKVEVDAREYNPTGTGEDEPLHDMQRALLALVAAVEYHDEIEQGRGNLLEELTDTFHVLVNEGEVANLKTVGDGVKFMHDKLGENFHG